MNTANISLYHIFLTAAQSPSISAAAQSLYISQPAVSKAIKKLEDSLGVSLLVRSSKGIQLTNEGNILYQYLHSAFETINAAEDTIKHIHELGIGHIKIGVSSTLCKHILLPCLKSFLSIHPHIQITIVCQSTSQTVELLENREIDIGLIAKPDSAKKLNYINAGLIHDLFVSTPQYISGLLEREKIGREQILNHANLILLDKNNLTRKYINTYLNSWNISSDTAMEVNSMELLIDFVKTGLGAGCIIREFITEELKAKTLIPIKAPSAIKPRQICFAYSKTFSPNDSAAALIEYLKNIYE